MIYTEILVQIFLYSITDFNHGKIYGVEICEYISWQLRVRQKKWDHIYQERYLAGSQIPLTRGGFELQISCMKYLWVSGLDNYFAWERFEVQTLEQDTIVV